MSRRRVRLDAVVERKQASLPRFVVVPGAAVAAWDLGGTTVVDVTIGGTAIGRRGLKWWGKGKDQWFFELTEAHCAKLGVGVGSRIQVGLAPASTELPVELASLVEGSEAARRAWGSLGDGARRRWAEHVRAAKRPETRRRRAARVLQAIKADGAGA